MWVLMSEFQLNLDATKPISPTRGTNEENLVDLFNSLGLGKYTATLVDNKIFTLSSLSKLTEKEIEAMGITLFG
jgi:SAM domain (Sterile alpha motif)